MLMAMAGKGRPRKVDPNEVETRAYDVYVNLRGLTKGSQDRILRGWAEEDFRSLFPHGSYLARKFSHGRFPAKLALEAKAHRDYPKSGSERQLMFIARYIAGDR